MRTCTYAPVSVARRWRPELAGIVVTVLLVTGWCSGVCHLWSTGSHPLHVSGMTWDRPPQGVPLQSAALNGIILPLASPFFPDPVGLPARTPQNRSATCEAPRLLVQWGSLDASATLSSLTMSLHPWPPNAGRRGAATEAWSTPSVLGTQPAPRTGATLWAPGLDDSARLKIDAEQDQSSSALVGFLLAYGGFISSSASGQSFPTSSLWAMEVATGMWTPLGPPALPSSSAGAGATPPVTSTQSPNVDSSSFGPPGSPQIDEFGCPWPTARDYHVFQEIGGYLWMGFGAIWQNSQSKSAPIG